MTMERAGCKDEGDGRGKVLYRPERELPRSWPGTERPWSRGATFAAVQPLVTVAPTGSHGIGLQGPGPRPLGDGIRN